MRPYLQVLLCAILWGLAGPLIRWSALPALWVLALRFSVPLFFTYAWIRWVEKRQLQPLSPVLAQISFFTLVGNSLYVLAFSFTSISNVLLLLYTRPVLTTLLAAYLLSEHVSKRLWCLVLLSFLGVSIIVSEHELSLSNRDLLGMLIALAAAFGTAFTWGLIKKHASAIHAPSQILFHQHLLGGFLGVLLLPTIFFSAPLPGLLIGLLYPLLVGFVGSIFYFMALRHMPLSHAMPITYIELLVAIACGAAFFGETLSWRALLGGALILASASGTLLEHRAARRR